MSFTEAERVILINQYTILAALDPSKKDDCDLQIEILTSGYEHLYYKITQVLDPEVMSEQDGNFVDDVLFMYRVIDTYLRKFPDDEEIQQHTLARFVGFDGNKESRFCSLAKFKILKLGEYSEQLPRESETDGFNTHWSVIPQYQAMLTEFNSIKDAKGLDHQQGMSRDDLLKVLAAAE